MDKKIEQGLLDENSSHTGGSQENQELEVDDLHFPVAGVPQAGDSQSTSSLPIEEENWDLDSLRLDQSYDSVIGAQEVLTVVRVRKPNNQEYFRVHPDEK